MNLAKPAGRVRWVICALLFAAIALSYVDRLVISVLKPTLQQQYHWSEQGYGDVVFWFQASYGLGLLLSGRLLDRIGPRLGYLLAMGLWTAAHMGHALVRSTFGFAWMRIPLALGESGTLPAALAAAAEWFPQSERAFAIGVFNAGANVGAIVTPLVVPLLTLSLGWQSAFIVTGLANLVWLVLWWGYYRTPRQHRSVSAAELAYIESDQPGRQPQPRAPWRRLLRQRQTWAYLGGRFLIDPVWWTFLFWLPDFFHRARGIDLADFGPPLVVIYLTSDVGSVYGGWLSSRLLRSGATVNGARKRAMFCCALLAVPVIGAQYTAGLWTTVALIGLACAAHQGFSANLYSMPADLFPRWAQGSVVGLGGFAGAVGGMLMAKVASLTLASTGSYAPVFVFAAVAYLLALGLTHLINPQYRAVEP
ncbi:MAG TPA: MFS transporter [Steroidobacteraceae bacterium]|nr:MFS transporter [Steroidobacteraceae bacterium]